eukprot:TRINITY_DN13259_c0_g1_i1.p1 TRINITY_DN13259_c0_g1~~TRINITY_DN13259_c0_g1_i1.p1  ORF type:complete len:464 (+),score=110.81 TRINITY_DN13259_c0_g1_i1:241-1632(+)
MALDLRETTDLVALLQMDNEPLQKILQNLKSLSARLESGGRICMALQCMFLDQYYHCSDTDFNSEILITCFILHSFSVGQANSRSPPPNTKSVLFKILQYIEGFIREKEAHNQQATSEFREKVALKVFVLQCLSGRQEVLTRTPKQILQDTIQELQTKHEQLQQDEALIENLKEAKRAYDEEKSTVPQGYMSQGTSAIIVPTDHYNVDSGPVNEWAYHTTEALDMRFDPICDRPPPPPLGVGEQELCWVYTEGHTTDLVWDTTMTNTPDEALELRDKVQKALRQNLASEEQQALKQKLSQHPDALLKVGVSPLKFPTLVDRNATVASHFITTLVQTNMKTAEEFVVSLVNMNVCLGAHSVMTELVKLPSFPTQYIIDYVLNALTCINNQPKKDARRVGIICTFCINLARETEANSPKSQALQSKDFLAQLTHFATENSSVSEASNLYKILIEREKDESKKESS